jgi:hypothetical protein
LYIFNILQNLIIRETHRFHLKTYASVKKKKPS